MPRKLHKWHYIYKTTCNVTGKYYIGMHSTSNLEDGYMGSGKRLGYSINKYGRENHTVEILEWLPDRSSLKEKEKEIVNENLLKDIMCMNLKEGGEGGWLKEFTFGSCDKEFHKQAVIKSNVSKWSDDSYREKQIKILSESTKRRIQKGEFKGRKSSFLGNSHSEETKSLMSDKAKERIGNKNSQFGSFWITNGKENKKVKITDNIPENWYKGRKIK